MRDEIPVNSADPESILRSRLHQLDLIIEKLRQPGSERLVPEDADG
jgi:hypothetical protein